MKTHYHIIIAGAGGIAEAAALMLAELSELTPDIYVGNRNIQKAEKLVQWVQAGTTRPCTIQAFHLTEDVNPDMEQILRKGDILLDCLPGHLAPKMAALAKKFQLHYANLTEYVSETEEIIALAKDVKTGFLLQTGLAPGYINVLGHQLFRQFCLDFDVAKADKLEMKVGALTRHAVAPHYYGFTWSPVGVATEYVKDALGIREFKKTGLPALTERSAILIDGIIYEEALTSGGAADLPDSLANKVKSLDYKTLRHPGHYAWIEEQIKKGEQGTDPVAALQRKMEAAIPHIEDDLIVLYASVEGHDAAGILRRREIAKRIYPQKIGKHQLRAIQTTTAAPLLQAAQILLDGESKGIILQSAVDPDLFLNGNYIKAVYG